MFALVQECASYHLSFSLNLLYGLCFVNHCIPSISGFLRQTSESRVTHQIRVSMSHHMHRLLRLLGVKGNTVKEPTSLFPCHPYLVAVSMRHPAAGNVLVHCGNLYGATCDPLLHCYITSSLLIRIFASRMSGHHLDNQILQNHTSGKLCRISKKLNIFIFI